MDVKKGIAILMTKYCMPYQKMTVTSNSIQRCLQLYDINGKNDKKYFTYEMIQLCLADNTKTPQYYDTGMIIRCKKTEKFGQFQIFTPIQNNIVQIKKGMQNTGSLILTNQPTSKYVDSKNFQVVGHDNIKKCFYEELKQLKISQNQLMNIKSDYNRLVNIIEDKKQCKIESLIDESKFISDEIINSVNIDLIIEKKLFQILVIIQQHFFMNKQSQELTDFTYQFLKSDLQQKLQLLQNLLPNLISSSIATEFEKNNDIQLKTFNLEQRQK